jgi:hypothetical protein
MRKRIIISMLGLIISTFCARAQNGGEEVLPQIEIGFKTITTGNYYSNKGTASLKNTCA